MPNGLCWHVASHVLFPAHGFQGNCLKISFLFLTMNISLHCFQSIFVTIYFNYCQSPTYYCSLGGHCSSVEHTAGQRVYNGTWSTMRACCCLVSYSWPSLKGFVSLEIGKDCPNVFIFGKRKGSWGSSGAMCLIMFGHSSEVTVARGIQCVVSWQSPTGFVFLLGLEKIFYLWGKWDKFEGKKAFSE